LYKNENFHYSLPIHEGHMSNAVLGEDFGLGVASSLFFLWLNPNKTNLVIPKFRGGHDAHTSFMIFSSTMSWIVLLVLLESPWWIGVNWNGFILFWLIMWEQLNIK
jgi:hypothetical protein